MRNEDESRVQEILDDAERTARAAVHTVRRSLRATQIQGLSVLLRHAGVVLERLDEADVHADLARAARSARHAEAHAMLTLVLTQEALRHAESCA
jgi:hypothetical protein